MPPKPQGARPLTNAERQSNQRQRRAEMHKRWHDALWTIAHATTDKGARLKEIAKEALKDR
jgi:hypothetical protein